MPKLPRGTIIADDLGQQGVSVDKSPLLADPNDLSKAQNAVPDPTSGMFGGIRKRPGLVKHTANVAAGSILGGIGAPITPADSDSDPGDTIPPGQMQITYWFRCPVASALQGSASYWYSLDGFLTTSGESGEPS